MPSKGEIIKFVKNRDYKLERFLDKGRGATGVTALLLDEELGIFFVCKKYEVNDVFKHKEYYGRFVEEVRLLFGVYHPNVVRIFSCNLYPSEAMGFIIMEYIDGTDIKSYLEGNPEKANTLFTQTISAFEHLEAKKILHRDIRPSNIMVTNDGVVKVIDFGFGKRVESSDGFGKSITLNWAASEPKEFEDGKYDFCTECYFVGKLFQTIINDIGIQTFGHSEIVRKMSEYDPIDRAQSFAEVAAAIRTDIASSTVFRTEDRQTYSKLADVLEDRLASLTIPVVHIKDSERVLNSLTAVIRSSLLESHVHDITGVVASFFSSDFYCRIKGKTLTTDDLAKFVDFFRMQSEDRRQIILSNLSVRLAKVPKLDADDIPF